MCEINLRDVFSPVQVQLLQYRFLKCIFFFHWRWGECPGLPFVSTDISQGRGLREKWSHSMESFGSLFSIFWYHLSGGLGLLHYSLSRVKINASYLAVVIVCIYGAWYCFVPFGWSKQLFYKTFLTCWVLLFWSFCWRKLAFVKPFFLVQTNWCRDV